MSDPTSEPKVSVSVERTINLGNYESVKIFVSLSGLTKGMTEEEMGELLHTTGRMGYDLIVDDIVQKSQEISRGRA